MIKNLLGILFAVVFTSSAFADEMNGFCSQVVDGATILVIAGGKQHTVKLGHVDAPQLSQKFGQEAKAFVEALALKRDIRLKEIEYGKGFLLAEVYSPKKQDSINRLLVREGLAWVKQEDDRYDLAQSFAKKRSLGIWSDPGIQSPEQYRAQKEQKEKQLQAAKEKEDELSKAAMMEMFSRKKSFYEEETARQPGYTAESKEPEVAQQTDSYIETRPGYRAEDAEAEARRLREEQKREECLRSFSSAHSGSGEESRLQREMDFNEWAIKCGAEAPYKSPEVIIDHGHGRGDGRYIPNPRRDNPLVPYPEKVTPAPQPPAPSPKVIVTNPKTGKSYEKTVNGYVPVPEQQEQGK